MIDEKKKDEIMLDLERKGITPNGLYPQAELKEKYCTLSDTQLKLIYEAEDGEKLRVHHLQQRVKDLIEQHDLGDDPVCKETQKNIDELASKIASTAAGAYGERKAGNALKRLYSDHYIRHNVYLKNDAGAAEYDYIVITGKGIFIVEVKHSNWDIIIEENGDYMRRGKEGFDYHYNIAEAMEKKRYILWNSLPDELKMSVCIEHIHQVVLFVGDKKVINKVKWLKVCYCSNICRYIDNCYIEKYRLFREDMKEIYKFLDQNNGEALFPLDIDLEKHISDFADTLYLIKKAKADKEKEETTDKNETESHETEERSDITKNKVKAKPESRSITRRFLFNTTKVAAAVLLATQLPRIIRFIDKL